MPEPRTDALDTQRRKRQRLMVIIVAVCVFAGVVLVGQFAMNSTPSPAGGERTSSAPADHSHDSPVVRRDANDPKAIGDVNAPVVLVQWTDLRCPFCASFHRDTLPTIIDEYVETGKVRIEYYDVAYFGDQSVDAAVAARAAGNQGRFEQYLDAVYADAPERAHPDLSREDLIAFAQTAGVPDIEAFTDDLDSDELKSEVTTDTATAQSQGVSAVPFFVAGDMALSGAQPIGVFRQFLDQAISEAEGS